MTPRRLGSIERLPQAIAEQVVRRVIEVIDIDEIVQRVDVNAVLNRVDVDGLMDRVDLDRVLERVDINAIAAKIDVEAIAERIDVDALVRRADLGPIIAQSTSGMLGEFLGLLRRQVVALDGLLDRVTRYPRRAAGAPVGPPALAGIGPRGGPPTREGEYAGGITRLLAFLADLGAAWGIFLLASLAAQAALRLFVGSSYTIFSHRPVGWVAISLWWVLYFSYQWSLSGRTIGMAILGARVVTVEGKSISRRAAVVRTLVLPVSVILWFVTLFLVEFRADRRSLHDRCAGTSVVYFWEARGASVPWLHRDD